MRALIADDEAPARARLRRALALADDIEIVGEASTGREAVAMIKRCTPDIVFLDIRMPGLDGFGVLEAIAADPSPYIVFVTADDEHALRAYDAGAVDYLLKPFTAERFDRMLERARERLPAPRADASRGALPPTVLHRILVSVDGRATFVATNAIDRVESERNYLRIFTAQGEHRLRATIGSLEKRLDPARFLRISRSTIVRLDAVRDMHEWSHGDYRVVLHDGSELGWSRRYRADAKRRFGLKD
ncbi:MAG: LytR/AlgR family response regulator transcription factor [Gemmatimonadaceae bacterium]